MRNRVFASGTRFFHALGGSAQRQVWELIRRLKERHPMVLVTHNLAQACRVAHSLACICVNDGAGEVMETACCVDPLDRPASPMVREYLRHIEA